MNPSDRGVKSHINKLMPNYSISNHLRTKEILPKNKFLSANQIDKNSYYSSK